MPRLSIIIAAKNEEAFLPEQLQAIAMQSVQPDEIVFVDDGSTDRTQEIMQAFAQERHGVTIIRLPESVGCARATNRGVAESSGDFLYIASANDVMRPRAMLAVAEAIRAFPGAHLFAGDVAGIRLGWGDADGNVVTPGFIDSNQCCRLFGPSGIVHAAGAVISRAAWDRHGGWESAWWPYSETLTWHVTACRYGLVYVPDEIAWVRQHDGSASTTVLDREWRRPLMEQAASFVASLEEPTRSRLVNSRLWDIREWAPEMAPLLAERIRPLAGVVS